MKRILPTAVLSLALLGAAWAVHAADEAANPAAEAKAAESFPNDWFYGDRPQNVVALEGKALPKVDLSKADWTGGKAPADEDLKGKILVIDVWATWCGPCRQALPHNAELAKEHAKDGVVVLGLCASGSAKDMKNLQEKAKVEYPTAFAENIKGELDKALHIPWFPYYIVVDRKGVVRGAGLHHEGAAKAVEALLKEQPAEKSADGKK